MGLPTEFLTFEQIKERWPPSGPMDLVGQPARVTDDTQMTIAVGGALLHVLKEGQQRGGPSSWSGAIECCGELFGP